jgi:chromosome segregation ATPase
LFSSLLYTTINRSIRSKEELSQLRSELSSLHLLLDSSRSSLAEKQMAVENLQSRLHGLTQEIDSGQSDESKMRHETAQLRDKIQSILIISSGDGASGQMKNEGGVSLRELYSRVEATAHPQERWEKERGGPDSTFSSTLLHRNDGVNESKQSPTLALSLSHISRSDSLDAPPSLGISSPLPGYPLRSEISGAVEDKLALMNSIEGQYREAVQANRAKLEEKQRLHASLQEALSLAQRSKTMLSRLMEDCEELKRERREGEGVLRECQDSLTAAVRRVSDKVELIT